VDKYDLSLSQAPSRIVLQIRPFPAFNNLPPSPIQGYLKQDGDIYNQGNMGFLKLWGVQEA